MWVEARCFPGPEGLSIFFRDTTERRAAEDALAASEGRLRQVFEASPMGMVTGDSAGRIVTANGAFLRIVGYGEDDLAAGRIRWDVLTPPEMIERDHRAIEEVARRGLSSVYEKEYVRADGSRVPVMLAIARFEGAADLIAFVIDISEPKRAEQALADASRRKDEFLAMLAHELRNPLAPIGTAAEILKRAGDAGDARQWAQVIERQVRHLTSLVDDLLDVSRVTRGLVAIERRPVDVQAVVAAALEQAQPLMHARGHAVHTRSAGGPLTVEGDFNRLVQVVANLLGNAAKYTPPGGRVEVGTWREGDEAVVCVADDGCGIDAGLLPAVFDLFTQAERTPDRAQGGLGIGLALVRSLVQLHGGQVEAASDGPGQGCRFTVRLPCVAATDTPAAAVVAEAPPVRRQRLLVVDDNRDAADTLAELLRLLGHEVGVAATGAAALALAGDGAWDACILDIGLPDMTGHELARRLREGPAAAGAIFIALTGYGQAQDRAMSRQAGFDHHLVKPPDAAALLAILGARQPGA